MAKTDREMTPLALFGIAADAIIDVMIAAGMRCLGSTGGYDAPAALFERPDGTRFSVSVQNVK